MQQDYKGSIADYTKAIEINPWHANAYYGRGTAKLILDHLGSGCSDLRMALELGNKDAKELINEYCR